MSDQGLFAGKNCLIVGATQDVGRILSLRLAARGAYVVAVDENADLLQDLAEHAPDQIAPLALDPADSAALSRLTSNWGPDPLHVLIFAQALRDDAARSDVLQGIHAATHKLAPLLEASNGAALVLFSAAGEGGSALAKAEAGALAQLTCELAREGARINALELHRAALVPKASAQLCATAMMMLLPMSAAISGAVLPVGQHDMPV